jgi:hypothetical protein
MKTTSLINDGADRSYDHRGLDRWTIPTRTPSSRAVLRIPQSPRIAPLDLSLGLLLGAGAQASFSDDSRFPGIRRLKRKAAWPEISSESVARSPRNRKANPRA